MDCIRILIADDHRAFAEAIAMRLAAEPAFVVIGTAPTVESTADQVAALQPDVLLLDVELGRGDGIALARQLRETAPNTKIIIVTLRDDSDTASAAVRAGVAGFVAKDATCEELVSVIHGVMRGHRWIEPRLLGPVLDDLARHPGSLTPEQTLLSRLSDRETSVLLYMVQGFDRASIARELTLSPNTVRTHTRNLLAKLEVHSSLEAVALAMRAGMRPESLQTHATSSAAPRFSY